MNAFTTDQIALALRMIRMVAECIQEAKSIPSSELYTYLMPTGITLAAYESIINTLKNAGCISESNHLLTWIISN